MKKILTFTNIFILICIVIYILNVFVVSPETGSMAVAVIEQSKATGLELNDITIGTFKALGTWGGHINDALGFKMTDFLNGQIWRAITVSVTHVHLPHILLNMLAMFVVGNKLEKKIGSKKVLILFLIITIIDSIVMGIADFNGLSNGASGGIFGLIGISIMVDFFAKGYLKENFNKKEIIYLLFYIIFTSFLTGSFWTLAAHAVGCIAGIAIGSFAVKNVKEN